ncbi:TM2 domain-containing protein [Kiloniella sp. EL199]|uniref:TM2 domain-containing protein n=1 Tax=Kiloniella sp. EL199 TaxID=2107581 RepID=UPI000EA408A0|nr:TM2 domain-containing protein [Kiloniella sp. EL199]
MAKKSLFAAYLLWIFTGIFGGHRWYLRKRWGAAIHLLFFCIYLATLAYITGLMIEYDIDDLNLIPDPETANTYKVIETVVNYAFFLQVIYLKFDLFWIYFAIKKQNTLEQATESAS